MPEGTRYLQRIIVMKTVDVEAIGCEQLAHSRYAAAPQPGIEPATS